MKIALLAVGALLALALIVVVVGFALPKGHRATRSAVFKQTPEQLFALVTGPQDWRPDLKSYERPPEVRVHERFYETDREGKRVEYEIVALEPPRHYVVRIASKSLPYGGTWTFDLSPTTANQTLLRITEDGEVYNPIFRFVSKFILGHTAGLDRHLKALAAKMGHNITVQN